MSSNTGNVIGMGDSIYAGPQRNMKHLLTYGIGGHKATLNNPSIDHSSGRRQSANVWQMCPNRRSNTLKMS